MSFRKIILIAFLLVTASCAQKEQGASISGSVDYVGSAQFYISQQPLHYKYSDKIEHPVAVDENGNFSLSIPVDSAQLVRFHIDEQSYPLYLKPGRGLQLTISRADFPAAVDVDGYSEPWDETYATYLEKEQPLLMQINNHLPAFREGDSTAVLDLYKKRYELAKEYFASTPFEDLYFKAIGEYLVKRLESITYQRTTPGFHPQEERAEVLQTAQKLDFFTFRSLHAQRAGIRDFTNAFANTFGVADRLEKKLGQSLMQYDVKRLGYPTLDSARTSVLKHIDGRRAKAYARLYLVAERIGEMPLKTAEPSYRAFLDDYTDFPRYTDFLISFYKEIKRVSPGQPAIPFTLPTAAGETLRMQDFRGRYVLLDFWASWCIPCLDEFPHMRKLYNNYSRDQFEILAISIEEDSLRWRQATEQFQNPWPQLYGGHGFEQETFSAYRGGGIPFYILVGPEGNILRYNDARPSFNLPQILDSLITQP
ncbi:TlpA family protein disulfide reductase [Fodinibius sediminis]|uniref:Thiol-disulfide isomerase or thioredoxin n=1 Tax=Fodinibius sediminis TaxID=1214077 RepID=A0A521DGT3_9BACT|nr:TlpA disulfide reductase family protein [Fodinibius sediminis]SMO70927.1 Thiol-disulfide isomerase or thioredoxin [Fodinibius sediminis]